MKFTSSCSDVLGETSLQWPLIARSPNGQGSRAWCRLHHVVRATALTVALAHPACIPSVARMMFPQCAIDVRPCTGRVPVVCVGLNREGQGSYCRIGTWCQNVLQGLRARCRLHHVVVDVRRRMAFIDRGRSAAVFIEIKK